jgi:ribosomal protein S18 acetylase RimI-like enzyme
VKGLKLRDAEPPDRDVVFEFCKRTWPGYGDYIPRVWTAWLRDAGGRLIVAEVDGVPVGIAKITDFGGGEVWLEGLRVDRKYRRQGIAGTINLEVLRTLRKMKPRTVRFCTGAPNRTSRQMGEKFGFEIVARLRYYWQKSRKGKVRGDWARRSEVDRVYDFVQGSRFIELTSGLIAEGWVFRELKPSLLEAYVSQKRVIVLRESGELEGVAIYPFEENDESLTLGFVDGSKQAIKVLARNCRYLAKDRGFAHCSAAVPTRGFARVVEDAGYARKDSVGQVVLGIAGKDLASRGVG